MARAKQNAVDTEFMHTQSRKRIFFVVGINMYCPISIFIYL